MAPKVLVSDKLSETAVQIFRDAGIDVDFQPDLGKDKEKLAAVIGKYDGLAIRSATKVTEKILDAATNLKVIARAGIGTDNIDKVAASKKGVIVMNTPFGNMITTAEHAIAMMFAVARQIPEASASTHAGKWEKSKFMGVELTSKTLGVIGAGNIGGIVCDRARGLKMKVIAYDPFLGEEKAEKMGVEKVELDELLARADFITLHVPFTDATANIRSIPAIFWGPLCFSGWRPIFRSGGALVVECAVKSAETLPIPGIFCNASSAAARTLSIAGPCCASTSITKRTLPSSTVKARTRSADTMSLPEKGSLNERRTASTSSRVTTLMRHQWRCRFQPHVPALYPGSTKPCVP